MCKLVRTNDFRSNKPNETLSEHVNWVQIEYTAISIDASMRKR